MKLPGVSQLFHLRRADSTQTLARALADSGSPAGTLVLADEQTAGRGRMERRWASAPGGVYATLILRPAAPPERLMDLSVVAARCVAKALDAFGVECVVKAPNDVLARPRKSGKGGAAAPARKICGILAEAASTGRRTEWVLLGFGVNVSNPLPKDLRAASLKSLTGRAPTPEVVLKRVLKELDKGVRAWARGR